MSGYAKMTARICGWKLSPVGSFASFASKSGLGFPDHGAGWAAMCCSLTANKTMGLALPIFRESEVVTIAWLGPCAERSGARLDRCRSRLRSQVIGVDEHCPIT